MQRHLARIVLLVALVCGGILAQPPHAARAVGQWEPAAAPLSQRYGHTAALLADGQVLVIGGAANPYGGSPPLVVTERYDPVTNRWTRTAPPPHDSYEGHTATPLADGRVLVLGGVADGGTADLYDPATDTWSAAAALAPPRSNHTATLLPDGRVLVVGGRQRVVTGPMLALADAAIYDPATGRWSTAPSLGTARAFHSATLLNSGQVLVVGGTNACPDPNDTTGCPVTTAERFDPATGAWLPAGTPTGQRDLGQIATLLADGRVLVVGGFTRQEFGDLYDPTTGTWRATSRYPLPDGPRLFPTATALPSGQILLAGGGGADDPMQGTLLYDPGSDSWTIGRTMPLARLRHTATLLRDGRVLLVGGDANSAVPSANLYADDGAATICFAETNRCLSGQFRDYWEAHGGLALNGFPLTDPRREVLEDGKEYLVQYFERVRLEYHPENPAPYDVLLGQFGRQILRDRTAVGEDRYAAPAAPHPSREGATYFAETGHNLGGRFRDYWEANGGLAQFGYPLTEEFEDVGLGGTTGALVVQYFERARFEYHPEHTGTPHEVQLGQFGRSILGALEACNSITGPFAALYRGNFEVAARLGPPARSGDDQLLHTGAGSVLPFEHGLMIYGRRGTEPGWIQVLCGSPDAGEAALNSRLVLGYPDTWNPSLPPGGGPGPRPGTYVPKYGFGQLWPQFKDCLGYATSPEETHYTQTAQTFANGILITPPDRTSVYLLYRATLKKDGPFGRYQRYTLP